MPLNPSFPGPQPPGYPTTHITNLDFIEIDALNRSIYPPYINATGLVQYDSAGRYSYIADRTTGGLPGEKWLQDQFAVQLGDIWSMAAQMFGQPNVSFLSTVAGAGVYSLTDGELA